MLLLYFSVAFELVRSESCHVQNVFYLILPIWVLDDEFGEKTVSVLLDDEESELVFIDHPSVEMSVENSLTTYEPHACIIVYSVVDKNSFKVAEDIINYVWRENISKEKAVILVGNKADLARSRAISSQGRFPFSLHSTFNLKSQSFFVFVSILLDYGLLFYLKYSAQWGWIELGLYLCKKRLIFQKENYCIVHVQ